MSRILFRYIFFDLLKVFILTAIALAGIMSFGGLLRPLTQHGLDGMQVMKIMAFLMPAMSTYSLPIAALFATTVTYGRLAADNELIACRASGISHFSITLPAVMLGMIVAILSMIMMGFIVPLCSLNVEKTIYSNIAKIISTQIERTHQTKFGQFTVFAQSATLPPPEKLAAGEQIVVLEAPMIVSYERPSGPNKARLPKEFWMARQATLHIKQSLADDEVQMEAVLVGGTKFPRKFEGGIQAGIEATQFGPAPIPSGLREASKFMDIMRLKSLEADPTQSRQVKAVVNEFIRDEQISAYSRQIVAELNSPTNTAMFNASGATFTLKRGKNAPVVNPEELGKVKLSSDTELEDHPIRFEEIRNNQTFLAVRASEVQLTIRPDPESDRVIISMELYNCILDTGGSSTPRASLPFTFSVPMTTELVALEGKSVKEYLANNERTEKQIRKLRLILLWLTNVIRSEMHARASFSIGCLNLVLIGAALGMMFRSGNYLNAFALSVVPAILTIVLIVTGQHIAENVPQTLLKIPGAIDPNNPADNPLKLGLALIWSGNLAVLLISGGLFWKLHRE